MSLTPEELKSVRTAHAHAKAVLIKIALRGEDRESVFFEVSAAVGVLGTLIDKETTAKEKEEAYPHKSVQRK